MALRQCSFSFQSVCFRVLVMSLSDGSLPTLSSCSRERSYLASWAAYSRDLSAGGQLGPLACLLGPALNIPGSVHVPRHSPVFSQQHFAHTLPLYSRCDRKHR